MDLEENNLKNKTKLNYNYNIFFTRILILGIYSYVAAIEQIEVLATGASATYGADAVAGVINYILKKDYQGAEINVSYGNSFAGSDEGKYNLNLVWGGEVLGC